MMFVRSGFSCPIGCVQIRESESSGLLYQYADDALHAAKKRGRSQIFAVTCMGAENFGGRVPVFLMMLYSEKEVCQLSVCRKAGNEKGGRGYESLCVF